MDINKIKGGKELNLTILISLVIMGTIGFLGIGDYFDNLYSQYPIIEHKTDLKDRIIKINNEHGALLIEMTTGDKIGIAPPIFIIDKPLEIYNLFEINDSLIKIANSDTLIIKRNGLAKILLLKTDSLKNMK
jgi:hypothetical protein